MDSGFFAQCIYLRSIIFEMLHLGERLKLQMPRGFQDTPFSLLFIFAKVYPHPLIIFSHSEVSIASLVRVVRPSIRRRPLQTSTDELHVPALGNAGF